MPSVITLFVLPLHRDFQFVKFVEKTQPFD